MWLWHRLPADATAVPRQQRRRRRGGVHVPAGQTTVESAGHAADVRRVAVGHRRPPPAGRRAGGVPERARAVGGGDAPEVRGGGALRGGGHQGGVLPPRLRRRRRRVRRVRPHRRQEQPRRGAARPLLPGEGRADPHARGAEVDGGPGQGHGGRRRRPGVGGDARDRPRPRARPLVVQELSDVPVRPLQGEEGGPHRGRRPWRPGALRCQPTFQLHPHRSKQGRKREGKGSRQLFLATRSSLLPVPC